MSDTAPLVSVVLPVYKSERFVADALRSVLAQTLDDLEVIVVDDGSPDRSVAICRSFDDPRIRHVARPNGGVAAARNTGIRHARGRYIAFLDSDDLWAAGKLGHHVAHLASRPDVGVSYGYSIFIDENGDSLGGYQMLGMAPTRPADCLIANPVGNGSNAVMRTAVFTEDRWRDGVRPPAIGCLFDEELRQAEDFELWLRIVTLTRWGMACTPSLLTYYRMHTSNVSADTRQQERYHLQAVAKVAAYAPDLVRRHGAHGESNLFWYLARNLVLRGQLAEARTMVRRAWARKPTNLRVYQLLTVVYLGLCRLLPPDRHRGLLRWGQRIYGRSQSPFLQRRLRRAGASFVR